MALSFGSKTAFFAALTVIVCLLPAKADIRAVNNCSYALTVFYESQGGAESPLTLDSGASAQIGLASPWNAVMWASQHANTNNLQCTQVEFNIAPANAPTWDFYDISLVNAYNEPVQIVPFNRLCTPPTCPDVDVSSLCQLGNKFEGPDDACINIDGSGTLDTPSVDLFRQSCPQAKVLVSDASLQCNSGSDYEVIWCPGANDLSTSSSGSQYHTPGVEYNR